MSLHSPEESLKVFLIDFTEKSTRIDHDDNSHHQQQNYLISLLKKKINTPKFVPFPLFNYSSIKKVENMPSDYFSYAVTILYKYNSIIVSKRNCFLLLDIDTKLVTRKIDVNLGNMNCFHVEECLDGNDYIYCTSSYLYKYDLKKLIEGRPIDECFIWKSETDLPNSWESATFQSDVYVCDYGKGLMRFNKNDGSFISVTPGYCMYGIKFTPENEMLLTLASGQASLEVRRMDTNGEWNVIESKSNTNSRKDVFQDPYSIFYEPISRYIYVSDCTTGKIVVFEREALNVVKTITGLKMNYGIAIDHRNGSLYVCSGNGYELQCISIAR